MTMVPYGLDARRWRKWWFDRDCPKMERTSSVCIRSSVQLCWWIMSVCSYTVAASKSAYLMARVA